MTTNKTSTDQLHKAIANTPSQPQSTGVDPYRRAQSYLKSMMPAISEALPKSKGMDAERLSRIVLTTLKMNPKLLDCTIESLLGAVLQSASLGLEPNLLGSCYFIPYKNTVSFQIGYKGLIDLVTRKGEVTSIVAQEVRSNDYFHYEFGRNETLVHRPAQAKERGEITCYYAYAHLKNGGFTFQVMSVDEIEKVRNDHSVSYKFEKGNSVWAKHPEAMSLKTVIKKLIKYLPISVETQSAVAHDETIRKDITAESVYVPLEDSISDYKVEILDKEKNENVG